MHLPAAALAMALAHLVCLLLLLGVPSPGGTSSCFSGPFSVGGNPSRRPCPRQVIYGDTDSIMIDTATTVYEDVRKVGAAVKAEVSRNSADDMSG